MKQVILLGILFNLNTLAQDSLDAPYSDLIHPLEDTKNNLVKRNDVESVIKLQTPIKSQGSRGTCSIFSATALLESVLIREGYKNYDLSEEWLEYLAMKGRIQDGSNSFNNISLLKKYGTVQEKTWEYDPTNWSKTNSALANERCGHLKEKEHKACLLGHRDHKLLTIPDSYLLNANSVYYDPEFSRIRKYAKRYKRLFFDTFFTRDSGFISTTSTVKNLLNKKIPVVMGVKFFYGAWNHARAVNFGIGRSLEHYENGIVGYPEPDSVDYKISSEADKSAGHSIVIVGYDDEYKVETQVKMKDGTTILRGNWSLVIAPWREISRKNCTSSRLV